MQILLVLRSAINLIRLKKAVVIMIMVYCSERIQSKTLKRKGTWCEVQQKPGASFQCLPQWTHKYCAIFLASMFEEGFLGGSAVKKSTCQCRRCGFDPWMMNIPWRRKWQLNLVFLPGKPHGQRNLLDHNPWVSRVRHDLVTEQQCVK